MPNSVKVSFSKEAIDNAIGLEHSKEKFNFKLSDYNNNNVVTVLDYHVGCTSVDLKSSRICVDIPYFGEYCFNLPVNIPISGKAEVCLDIKTTFGIPTGAIVQVKINGVVVYQFSIGF